MSLARSRASSRARASASAEAARAPDALTRQLQSTADARVVRVGQSRMVDYGGLVLKRDASRRPFWVTPTGRVFLEAWSPLYAQARDFLIAICEPVSRPDLIHEYRLDKNALFAAASMGMTADIIIAALNRMSKVPVADRVADFIRDWTGGYGKVKLVLKRGRFFVESAFPGVLRVLNKHPAVRAARVRYLSDGTRVVGKIGRAHV
jgi:DNA excision repair protein ERCC-3